MLLALLAAPGVTSAQPREADDARRAGEAAGALEVFERGRLAFDLQTQPGHEDQVRMRAEPDQPVALERAQRLARLGVELQLLHRGLAILRVARDEHRVRLQQE